MASDPLQQAALCVVRIGKNKDNDLVLEKPGISRYHTRLSLYTDFLGLLEDLDSTYGTEVDNHRIVQKIVTPNSKIVLGTVVPLDLKPLFEQINPKPKAPFSPPEQLKEKVKGSSLSNQIQRLSWHFAQYTSSRQEIQTGDPKKKAWVRVAVGWIPFAGVPISSPIDAYVFNTTERMQVLDEAFKRDYVCPNPDCRQFWVMFPTTPYCFRNNAVIASASGSTNKKNLLEALTFLLYLDI